MKTLSIIKSLALVLLVITANSCFNSRPRVQKPNPAFSKHISAFTFGMISRKSTIRIELAHSIYTKYNKAGALVEIDPKQKHGFLPDSSLLEGLLEISPSIKGKILWISDRIIEFVPEDLLPSDMMYSASFNLGKIMDVEDELEIFDFQFSTYKQEVSVNINGLQDYNDYNIEWQYLTGQISFSDYVDSSEVFEVLKAKLDGKKVNIEFEKYYYSDNTYNFKIDSIERTLSSRMLEVNWDASVLNLKDKGWREYKIRSLGDFSVSNINVKDDGDQVINLYFSDPIFYTQDLKGLIRIEGLKDDLKYAVNNNLVEVFLTEHIEGKRKVTVSAGIKNFKGYKMISDYEGELYFEEPKPLVRIKGDGSILPNSQGLIFPFEAISLKAVDVRVMKIFTNNINQFFQANDIDGSDELYRVGKTIKEIKVKLDYDKKKNLKTWNTFVIDLNKLISVDPGAIYRVSIKFNKEYAICNCDEQADENNEAEGEAHEEEEEEEGWRDEYYQSYDDGYDYWYDYNELGSPCNKNYYYGKSVSRNILASDIGLVYKLDYSKLSHVFTTNLVSSKPMAGVQIQYFDFTNQLIASGISNQDGMLSVQLKTKPYLLVAKYGKQRGYMKLTDGNTNSLSKFEVDGEMVQKGIKGFLYAERGVWRPGDSIYLNFILEDKLNKLPDNHPVKMQLISPDGGVVYNVVKSKNVNGLYDFRTCTNPDARTGNYSAVVTVGNKTYSKTIKVETVKPNRLKIQLDFDEFKLGDSVALLSVRWLHGAVAKNLRATTEMSVFPSSTVFEKYKTYSFDSPLRSYSTNNELIFDNIIDENGMARIKTKMDVGTQSPGTLTAVFLTRVFEQGGDYSIDRFSKKYQVFKNYVGVKAPVSKNYNNALETGKTYRFDVVSLSKAGKLVDLSKINVKVYKLQWRWWYERSEENLSDYIARSGSIVVFDTTISSKDGKSFFNFKARNSDYGRYLVVAQDMGGGHQCGTIITFDYPYWERENGGNKENITMLNLATDKQVYNTGDMIKLTIPTISNGTALVSIENSRKVLKKFWINTTSGETRYELLATPDMTPNAYFHVTLLQPHLNTKNDLPIRMYGVLPVMVEDPNTRLEPIIKMADVVKPESNVNITISEKKGKKMTYTLAVVDDGLLDLTRFKTPQPWDNFYTKEALGVKTWDLFDDVIGAFAGKFDRLLSIGGDGEAISGKALKANRFKPMVIHLGPFNLEPGKARNHKVSIPSYIGSARVMVVAENAGAYGNTEKTVQVKKPLMVLATLPRVLGPDEIISLPVDVFAMENHVKNVAITVEATDNIVFIDSKSRTLKFEKQGDEMVYFSFKTARKIGVAKFKIKASGNGETAVQEIEIQVRPSNPKVTEVVDLVIEPGKTITTNLEFKWLEGTNKASVELSSIPPMGLEKRLGYLIHYPYGCIEQTTSSVFPQLYLTRLMNVKEKQKIEIERNVKEALKRLVSFQTSNGGFAYWPGESHESEWGTNYAGHFLLEAERAGYSIPTHLLEKWVSYQQGQARNWSNINESGNRGYMTQAYRLYTLALSKNAEVGAMNRLLEEKNLDNVSKWMLASAYKMAGLNEVAIKMVSNLPTAVSKYKDLSYNYGSDLRDKAIILRSMSIVGLKSRANNLAREIAQVLSTENWLNTQETAYSLLAICEFSGIATDYKGLKFNYSIDNSSKKITSVVNSAKRVEMLEFAESDFNKKGILSITNTGNTTLFAKVSVEGIPLQGDKTSKANNMSMSVDYFDLKGNPIKPDSLMQGTDFVAKVSVKNTGQRGYLRELVVNQIFAAGWEIRNDRLFGNEQAIAVRYQDIRDDRVYSFFDLGVGETKVISIMLNASYVGKFYLPTIYSEAMYDNSISARLPGRWVTVYR